MDWFRRWTVWIGLEDGRYGLVYCKTMCHCFSNSLRKDNPALFSGTSNIWNAFSTSSSIISILSSSSSAMAQQAVFKIFADNTLQSSSLQCSSRLLKESIFFFYFLDCPFNSGQVTIFFKRFSCRVTRSTDVSALTISLTSVWKHFDNILAGV